MKIAVRARRASRRPPIDGNGKTAPIHHCAVDAQQTRLVLEALEHDGTPRQIEALEALARIEGAIDRELVARLVELLAHSSKAISRRAADALVTAVEDAVHRCTVEAALVDTSRLRRWGAAFVLYRGGQKTPAVCSAALDALALDDGDIRWAAAEVLCAGAADNPAVQASLLRACREGPPEQRKMSLYCLRNIDHRETATYLSALDDDAPGVRHAALSGIARCGDADADTLDRLLAFLADESDAGVRRAAAVTLGRVMAGNARVARELERAVAQRDDGDFARAVAIALRGEKS